MQIASKNDLRRDDLGKSHDRLFKSMPSEYGSIHMSGENIHSNDEETNNN